MEVRCCYCKCAFGGYVERNSDDCVKYNNKNYHKECAQLQAQREEFVAYLCFRLGLKQPGPRILKQINDYLEKGYTYLGMLNTLKYFFEVLKRKDKFTIENKTIGIIPYLYGDAQDYFRKIEERKKLLEQEAENLKPTETVVVSIPKKRIQKPRYNLDDIN